MSEDNEISEFSNQSDLPESYKPPMVGVMYISKDGNVRYLAGAVVEGYVRAIQAAYVDALIHGFPELPELPWKDADASTVAEIVKQMLFDHEAHTVDGSVITRSLPSETK